MVGNKKKNRLGIFVFYDRDNFVDDYVKYLLEDITQNLSHLTILSNSKLDEENLNALKKFTSDIVIRENIGLDAGALSEYIKKRTEYLEYEEVVCFNDTFFGPLYPFKTVFDQMDQIDADFWGLSLGNQCPDGYGIMKDGYLKEHLQTFFYVFRQSVTHSSVFQDYWKTYDIAKMSTFYDVVTKHELQFTNFLKEHGFKYAAYLKETNVSPNYKQNYNTYFYNSESLLMESQAPFLKKKVFSGNKNDLLYLTDYQDLHKSVEYIEKNTSYDTSMIWKNILRLYNLADIKTSYGFEKIVTKEEDQKEISYFIYIDDPWIIKLLTQINGNIKFYTSKEEIKNQVEELGYKITKISSTEWSKTFAKEIKKVKTPYIGYLYFPFHQDRITLISEVIGKNYFTNLISCGKGITSLLKENSRISVVYAPENLHFDYFTKNTTWEAKTYQKIQELLPDYKPLSPDKVPVSSSLAWITRTDFLQEINFAQWNIEENTFFSEVLSIYLAYYATFNVQYPMIAIEKEYAEHRIEVLNYIYLKTFQSISHNEGLLSSYPENLARIINHPPKRTIWQKIKNRLKRYAKKILRK